MAGPDGAGSPPTETPPTETLRIAPAAPPWPAAVAALTTTRAGCPGCPPGSAASRGVYAGFNLAAHVGDEPAAVAENRRILAAATGVARVQWLNQVHGRRVIQATAASAATVPEADAAWTTCRGLALAVLTADCVPVVVADRGGALVAVAHAGWRGLVGGVVESLLEALPARTADLVAWLGPAIGPAAFEVGEDVVAAITALPDGDRLAGDCAASRPGSDRWLVNLFRLTEGLLRRGGVAEILSDHRCTYRDARFYSYRRDGTTGRMATLAWLPD
jgi:polyphenol oxidase